MTQKFKILVTRKWPRKVEEKLLESFDTTLNSQDRPLSESELVEAMKSYDALLPTVTDPITDRIISTPGVDIILSCLLYTSPSPRDATLSRMPSSA